MSFGLDRPLLALRTLRHLRPRQLVALTAQRTRRSPAPRRVDGAAAHWDEGRGSRILTALAELGPAAPVEQVCASAESWIRGAPVILGGTNPWLGDWKAAGHSPLWSYHLQYHGGLADLAWHSRNVDDGRAIGVLILRLDEWFAAWGKGGAPAWDPYPLAVRSGNWLRVLAWAGDQLGSDRRQRLRDALSSQTDLLSRTLEWHLMANHLLREVATLTIASAPFRGPAADAMHGSARDLFERQLRAQVGGDGVHEERSPLYHARALRDALEVIAALQSVNEPLGENIVELIGGMADALRLLRRGDGSLFLLNDSANDHGLDLDRILDDAERLCGVARHSAEGVHYLGDSRIVIVADPASGDRLLVDLGAPSPAHQPGHAHAGALGFELDIAGVPVIVDSGCSGYDGDPFRPYLRSTRAHNTVAIDGRDQSEMWQTFRVARRAAVEGQSVTGTTSDVTVSGACRPYHDKAASHQRILRRAGRTILVDDRVLGAGGARLESHLHFHPDWNASLEMNTITLEREHGAPVRINVTGADKISLHRGERGPMLGWYAPEFGEARACWSARILVRSNDERTFGYEVSVD